jgi:hypothetical protein
MKHCIIGLFFVCFMLLLPSLHGGSTNDFEGALIELESRAASNIQKAVATGDVEPLRTATWAFGQFQTQYNGKREIIASELLTRLNTLRLMFAQAAFSMRDRTFDVEKERERMHGPSISIQDRIKCQTVFNREAALALIHKGFVAEARYYGGVSEDVPDNKVKAFKQLVDKVVRDADLKKELLATPVISDLGADSTSVEPFSRIRFDGTNLVFTINTKPTRYILRTTHRDTWLSSPGEEISVPLGGDLSVIVKSTVLTFKALPGNLSFAGFSMRKVVNPRSASDHAHPESEAVLLLKGCLRNPADYPDTPNLTGLVLTNIPAHKIAEMVHPSAVQQ